MWSTDLYAYGVNLAYINLHGILGKAELCGNKARQGVRVNPYLLSSNKSRPHLSTYVNLIKGGASSWVIVNLTNGYKMQSFLFNTGANGLQFLPKVGAQYSGLFPWGANFRFSWFPRVSRNFHPQKFSTLLCSAVYTCSNLDRRCFLWLFFATCSALGLQGPLSQAVPRVRAEEVNRAV